MGFDSSFKRGSDFQQGVWRSEVKFREVKGIEAQLELDAIVKGVHWACGWLTQGSKRFVNSNIVML